MNFGARMRRLIERLDDHLVNVDMLRKLKEPLNARGNILSRERGHTLIHIFSSGFIFKPNDGEIRLHHAGIQTRDADVMATEF